VRRWLWLPLLLVLSSSAGAAPLSLEVLSTQYRTFVSADLVNYPDSPVVTSRSEESSDPISDAIQMASTWTSHLYGATAAADFLSIAMTTRSGYIDDDFLTNAHSIASAEAIAEFAPTSDGLASLTVDLAAGGNNPAFSRGSISLVDLTTGQQIWQSGWQDGWTDFFAGSIAWVDTSAANGFNPWYTASLTLNHTWDASHRYAVSLYGRTNANFDNQTLMMQISGVQTVQSSAAETVESVPEPATLVLGLTGMAAGAIARRRRARTSRQKR
jgi:hypothetical protein